MQIRRGIKMPRRLFALLLTLIILQPVRLFAANRSVLIKEGSNSYEMLEQTPMTESEMDILLQQLKEEYTLMPQTILL